MKKLASILATVVALGILALFTPTVQAGTGTVVLTCTTGTTATVALDTGAHSVGAQRKMQSGASGTVNF